MGADIGNVRDPRLVRRLHIELAIQRIVDDQRRLAAIRAGAPLVADLRADSRFAANDVSPGELT